MMIHLPDLPHLLLVLTPVPGPPDTSNAGKHVDTPSPYAHLEEGWRYKVPADEDATLVIGNDTLYWCRHLKRRPHIPLVGYPRRWVILTMCLGFTGTRGMIHPATTVHNQLCITAYNVLSLTLMVDFSDQVTIGQYHMVRFKELRTGKSFQEQSDETMKSPLSEYKEPQSPLPQYIDFQSS